MLDDDLMRIIGDCQEKDVESFELSNINEKSKNSFDKSRSSLNKSGESLDSLINNFGQMEIKTLKEAPAQPEYKSIFACDPVWTPQASQEPQINNGPQYGTVNNITINNYNGYPQQQAQPKMMFPSMNQVFTPQPSIAQASEMA
jgi:hypothetical protein